jgi:Spy/CpxP family protein refolding chaperone
MSKTASRLTSSLLAVLVAVAFAATALPALGDGPVKQALRKGRRALPAHYGPYVTEEQKEKILKIQDEYGPKIDALNEQIKTLKKERDDKIAAVITPEQKKQIDEAAAAAKAKRKGATPAPAPKPTEPAPATPPAEPQPPK